MQGNAMHALDRYISLKSGPTCRLQCYPPPSAFGSQSRALHCTALHRKPSSPRGRNAVSGKPIPSSTVLFRRTRRQVSFRQSTPPRIPLPAQVLGDSAPPPHVFLHRPPAPTPPRPASSGDPSGLVGESLTRSDRSNLFIIFSRLLACEQSTPIRRRGYSNACG